MPLNLIDPQGKRNAGRSNIFTSWTDVETDVRMLVRTIFILLTLPAVALPVSADCVLPVPDGGEVKPSKANVHGKIARIESDGKVVIAEAGTNKFVTVELPANPEIYSAFGGDIEVSQLKVGQTVWVWFVDCKRPNTGNPTSAYFQVYSRNPKHRP